MTTGKFPARLCGRCSACGDRELEQYLKDIGQSWREDSTNTDEHFTRNRVRKLVVPLLEQEFNPAVAENLAELAEIARGEEDYWENEVSGWLGTTVQWSQPEWARAVICTEESGSNLRVRSRVREVEFRQSPHFSRKRRARNGAPGRR